MKQKLSTFERHQKKIALSTLKLTDAGASILGGMTKEEARNFLRRLGYSAQQIAKLEA